MLSPRNVEVQHTEIDRERVWFLKTPSDDEIVVQNTKMRIPKLNLRKKRGRKNRSPLKCDPTLVNILNHLQTINDYNSFEIWRKEFLERFGYFLIDEGVERSEEAYHVRLRVKVDKLVRNISKIARHVNDRNLSSTQVTDQARNSLDDGMKSCEDVCAYLKVLSPLTATDEHIVGFTKCNIVAVLVETSFKEYERLNMCRDILQVLRENFVNSVAEPQHLAAFNKYEEEIVSFKSVVLEDVGVLPVLKKQRQLKSPLPPKALIAEIRRGVLREALISKSVEAKQVAQANKNPQEILDSNETIGKLKFDRMRVNRMQTITEPSLNSEVSSGINEVSVGEIIDPKYSLVDIKQDSSSSTSLANKNRLENDHVNIAVKTKVTSKSLFKCRPTTNSSRRLLKQFDDDDRENNVSQPLPKRRQRSKSPKRDSGKLDSKTNRLSSRRRGVKNAAVAEDVNGNDDSNGLIGNVQMLSSRNRSTPLNKMSKAKFKTPRELIQEKQGLSIPDSLSTNHSISNGNKATESLVISSKENYQSIGKQFEDDESTSSVDRKKVQLKPKSDLKGKRSLKNTARERNIAITRRDREALMRKKEFSMDTLSVLRDEEKELSEIGEDFKFKNPSQNVIVKGTVLGSSKRKKSAGIESHKRNVNQNRAHIGSTVAELRLKNDMTSNQIASFGLSNDTKIRKEIIDKARHRLIQGKVMRKKKNIVHSKSSKQKKNSLMNNDYKKIIHGKSYSLQHAKKVSPELASKISFPVLVSEEVFLQEASKPTENSSVGPKFEKLQMKPGEKLSSNILLSLLDDCIILSREEDELKKFHDKAPNKDINRSRTNNGIIERCQPLLGHMVSKSTSRSFDHGKLEENEAIKLVDFEEKHFLERPSFYETFIKPLTTIEHDFADNNKWGSFCKDEEQWEAGKDIFEDSVCSTRYRSGHPSIAEAVAKFYSEESIIELQRLTEIGKQKDEATEMKDGVDPETRSSSSKVTRSEDEIVKGVTETVEPTERRMGWTQRIDEICRWNHFGMDPDFVENNEAYGIYDQTKEILTAEEEAARMADEVAKLQIALEDNQHALDFNLNDEEKEWSKATYEGTWEFNESEDLDMTKKMRRVEFSEDELLTNSTYLDIEEANEASDEDALKFKGCEELDILEKMPKQEANEDKLTDEGEGNKATDGGSSEFDEGEEWDMAGKMRKLELSEDELLTNHIDRDDEEEEGDDATGEGTCELKEEGEDLDMVERMPKLEVSEDNLLTNSTDLDDEEEEGKDVTNEDTWKFKEGEVLEILEKIRRLEVSDDELLAKCTERNDTDKEENKTTDEDTWELNEVEELEMANKQTLKKNSMGRVTRHQYDNESSFTKAKDEVNKVIVTLTW